MNVRTSEAAFLAAPERALDVFRAMLDTGDHTVVPELYAADAVLDVNLPEWRYQLRGAEAIQGQLDAWHPSAPRLVEWRPRSIPGGAIVELALWEGPDHELYSRSVHLLEVGAGPIVRHIMYCTGDWTRQRYEQSLAAAAPV